MNKKIFKKALAVIITIALLLTGSDYAPDYAEAAENLSVKGIYTNFQKATMVVGGTRQILTYKEPDSAAVQEVSFKSSDVKVAEVSKTGQVTAVGTGTATITVTAMDGSGQKEQVIISVLKDLVITGKSVDSDNDVIVLDKTYGNVTVDASVGDADIYLSGVRIIGSLTLAGGGGYTVFLYDTTAKNAVIEETKEAVTSSFAAAEEKTAVPSLFTENKTVISNLSAKVSAVIRQGDGSRINNLKIIQEKDEKIKVFLEGYTRTLSVDASLGSIEIAAAGSRLTEVVVTGAAEAGDILFTNGGDASVDSLILKGTAKVELAVPATRITVDSKSKGSVLTTRETAGTIINAGSDSKITVGKTVDNLESKGVRAVIDVIDGASVITVHLAGEASTVKGAGEVAEISVNAPNCSVDTVNTLVAVGNVLGTKVQGEEVPPNSSVTTAPVGSGGIMPPAPEERFEIGDVLLDNDFEDGTYGIYAVQGTVTIHIAEGGKDSAKAARISGKSAVWAGAGVDLSRYAGKDITVRIQADIKAEEAGQLKATIKYNGDQFTQAAKVDDAEGGTWYSLDGRYYLGPNVTSAVLYFEAPGTADYYLDNIKITVDSFGEPEAVELTGVSISKTSLTMREGASETLLVTVAPVGLPTDYTVTWSSGNTQTAAVNSNGKVTAVAVGGPVTITASVHDNVSGNDYTLSCEVTVEPAISSESMVTFDDIAEGTALKTIGWSTDNISATVIADPDDAANKILKVEPRDYNSAAVIGVTLPEGKTLADYSHIEYKAYWAAGDVGYKTVKVEAAEELSGQFNRADSRVIASYNRNAGKTTGFATERIELNGTSGSLGGTFEIAVGIHCAGSSGGENTVYYLDDIVFIPAAASRPITGVSLNHSTLSLILNNNATLAATIMPWNYTTSGTITWTSSDTNVATVSSEGVVTAVGTGTAIITAATAIDGESTTAYEAACAVTVTEADAPVDPPEEPDPTVEIVFKTGFESGETALSKDGGTITPVTDVKRSGSQSILVATEANWHGPQYTLDNTTGTSAVTYTVSSYVRKVNEADTASVRYVMADSPWTTYASIDLTTQWQKFETEITVAAGAALKFRLAPVDSQPVIEYYADDFKITKPVADIPSGPSEILLFSAEFENGLNPFTEWPNNVTSGAIQNGGTFAVTGSALGFNSDKALSVSADAGYKGIGYKFSEPGTYKITVAVKNIGSGTAVQLYDQTANNTLQTFTISASEWTFTEYTITITESKAVVLSPAWSNSAHDFLVDDVKIYKITG